MSIQDDNIRGNDEHELLEGYLKQFQPMIAEPLPGPILAKARRRRVARIVWASAFASILIAAALMLDYKSRPRYIADKPIETQTQPITTLTINQADRLLAQSSSIADALDTIARTPQIPLPQGANSVLATLGKGNFKL